MKIDCRGRYVAWFAALCLVFVAAASAGFVNADYSDTSYDGWLQYVADTSDVDPVGTITSTTPPDMSGNKAMPNEEDGGDSGDHDKKKHKKDDKAKDHQGSPGSSSGVTYKGNPKNNIDSIGVLPKPKGKSKKITVSQDGKGDFKTINAALFSVTMNNTFRTIIHIKAGIYKEKITINESKHYITFLGDGMNKTIITWNDTAGDFNDQDVLLKTYHSATVGVSSEWFIAQGVTFVNTAPSPPPGAVLRQAVAFRISADKAAFYNCSFFGYQDTLYDHKGRHYFENCFIQGSIDFIFGNGRSLYRSSQLHVVADSFGSLTAQKKNESKMHTGFSFVDCHVDGTGIIYLGRAWGNYSRTVFSYTWFSDIIFPPGWSDFGFPDRQQKVFYGQYMCSGPGANTAQRVAWARNLTPKEAKPFLSVNFINGKSWLTTYIKKPKFT